MVSDGPASSNVAAAQQLICETQGNIPLLCGASVHECSDLYRRPDVTVSQVQDVLTGQCGQHVQRTCYVSCLKTREAHS
eukprot:278929-Amphidinium_carterae.1